jgi:hypothetical protein
LFFKDILINASYSEEQRGLDKTKVLFGLHGIFNIFDSPKEVYDIFSELTAKQFCLAIDFRTYGESRGTERDIVKEIFNCCSTYFIHKNSDESIRGIIVDRINKARIVAPKFQIEDLNRRKQRINVILDEDKNKIEEKNKNIKYALVEATRNLEIGQIIFKTVYKTKIQGTTQYSEVKDIIYNIPIKCCDFETYYAYVKTFIATQQAEEIKNEEQK